VVDWVTTGQGNPEAWAIGRVSLWGRVAEWELGWRGEYAYPYALTVYSDDETIGPAIRDLYLVDVERAPAIVEPPPEADNELQPDTRGGLLSQVRDLEDRLNDLAAAFPNLEAPTKKPTHRWVGWDLRISSDPRLLVDVLVDALRKAIIADGHGAVRATQVAEQLSTDDGNDPTLPVSPSCVTGIALLLKDAALRGDVIQVKRPIRSNRRKSTRPATHAGSSLWTLPGIALSEKLTSSYAIFGNEPDQLERDILDALRNAVDEANGEAVGIGAVLPHLGIDGSKLTARDRTKKGKVAARLARLEKRGLVQHDGPGSKPKRWMLSEPKQG
jgi:hypothetical protein